LFPRFPAFRETRGCGIPKSTPAPVPQPFASRRRGTFDKNMRAAKFSASAEYGEAEALEISREHAAHAISGRGWLQKA
jgi:hypothetical protein